MLPRKRQRPNPSGAAESAISNSSSTSSATAAAAAAAVPAQTPERSTTSEQSDDPRQRVQQMPPPKVSASISSSGKAQQARSSEKEVRKTQSWYGSWPRPPKATASTSLARENISGDTIRSQGVSELHRFNSKGLDETSSVRSERSVAGSAPPVVADQPDHDMKEPTDTSNPESQQETPRTEPQQETTPVVEPPKSQPGPQPTEPTTPAPTRTSRDPSTPKTTEHTRTPSAWFNWLARTPFTESSTSPQAQPPVEDSRLLEEPSKSAPQPDTEVRADLPPVAEPKKSDHSDPKHAPSSWFGLWSSAATPTATMKSDDDKETANSDGVLGKDQDDVVMEDAPPQKEMQQSEPPPKAGATWAFWSRDSPKTQDKANGKEEGEIAVIGQGSENRPRRMTSDGVSDSSTKDGKPDLKTKEQKLTWRKTKRDRPLSMEGVPPPSPARSTTPSSLQQQSKQQDAPEGELPSKPTTAKAESSTKSSLADAEASSKPSPNLLLPSFSSTYQMKENPSILKQIAQLLLRTSQPPTNHVFRVQEPPKVRKAIAIGVHGLFPATYLRPMIGQPTGTSLRFAGLCADAIRRWTDAHGSPDCEIERVALEGEGRISDRVENLWKLMLNWIDQIRRADLIIIACHSQGVPVSVMLLEKLIDLGIITDAKIGVCAMAGVSLGPFPDYKSSLLMGSAAELWDFGNPQSQNSQRFETALKHVLDYGARITFIGSIDDQVVPMESAVYSPASHPYIYRAVFIDGRVHAPDFIAHLIGFALKLRNLGVTDHGLVRELSLALAGSLYSGEGHSRIYFDDAVYDLAVSHALETTSLPNSIPCQIHHRAASSTASSATTTGVPATAPAPLASTNPYVLPWIMRGLLEEDFVKTELSSETEELLRQFDDWKPSNKALKDVKYRLEVVRSKL